MNGEKIHRVNLQVHLMKDTRAGTMSAIEISSVDGFQGREKEAIIISMVHNSCSQNLQAVYMHIRSGQQKVCSNATADLHLRPDVARLLLCLSLCYQ